MATETLDGVISRVIYHKATQYSRAGVPYLIAQTASGDIIKGEMMRPLVNQPMRFYGEWTPAKPPRVGREFAFRAAEPVIGASRDEVAAYLARTVEGLGPVKGAALVEHLGDEPLDKLREAALADAMASHVEGCKGITPAIVESLANVFRSDTSFLAKTRVRLAELFAEYRVARKVVDRLLDVFGSQAPDVIALNPYLLLEFPGVGWKTADAIALGKLGYAPDGVHRHAAAIQEALEQTASDGHTFAWVPDLEELTTQYLGTRDRKSVV